MSPAASTSSTAGQIRIKSVPPQAVLRWLALGWRDLRRAGFPSLLHGIIVSVISIAAIALTFVYWQLLPGLMSGFVIVGPFLATGLYALSCRIEKNQPTSLQDAINAWRHGSRCLIFFGILLVLAASAWVLFSVAMFHLFIQVEINRPLDFFRYVLVQDNSQFILWTILGGLGSALAFAVTVCTLPLLVERDINTSDAIHASVRAVSENSLTMVIWALTILIIIGLSFITLMLGFIVLYPLLGHASWHVYRDLIDAESLNPRCEFPSDE